MARPRVRRAARCPLLAAAIMLAVPLTGEETGPGGPAPKPDVSATGRETPLYDPLRGIDADGRIPRSERPADIHRPERWRYIPEGRIKPGGIVDRLFISTFVAPIIYYEEAVGGGGGVSLTDIDFRSQRRREFAGLFLSRSTEGQERYSLVWKRWLAHRDLPAGGVIQEERNLLRVVVGYEKTLTRRFHGFGSRTAESAESSYTDEVAAVDAQYQVSLPRVGDDIVAYAGARPEQRNLAGGRVEGRPTTGVAFPTAFAAGDGVDALWVAAGLRYDTRDSIANPYRGGMVGVQIDWAPWQQGPSRQSDGQAVGRGGLIDWQATWAVPLPGLFHDGGSADEENPPTDVLAIGAQMRHAFGDLPFWALPSLGGRDTLRGHIGDRFTDRAAWHASAEWRLWVVPRGYRFTDSIRLERLGVAPFVDAGSVASSVRDLDAGRIHVDYGLGFRLGFERAAIFRIDVGRSRERTVVNVAFGMAF